MNRKTIFSVIAVCVAIVAGACGPSIRIHADKPLVVSDLQPYAEKRAVLLAFREPESERGLGNYFAGTFYQELLRAAPFHQLGFKIDGVWFGLERRYEQEMSTAMSLGAKFGYDIAIIGDIEQFVYSRTSRSRFVVTISLIDTSTGELVYSDRLVAEGFVDNIPQVWTPTLSTGPSRDDIFASTARRLVKRMWIKWIEGEVESATPEEEGTVEDQLF